MLWMEEGVKYLLFMDMDKTVGGNFEKGLAHMKLVRDAEGRRG